jgi:hypothetical protein
MYKYEPIKFKQTKEARVTAYMSSTELGDIDKLRTLYRCTKQDVIREGVRQLKEATYNVLTRENLIK